MDLSPSPRAQELLGALESFMDEFVYPAEADLRVERDAGLPAGHEPAVLDSLRVEARRRGLWNLCVPGVSGLGYLDYAYIAEITGRSPDLAPKAVNGGAPDSVNMVMLDVVATADQRTRFLEPLLEARSGSAFAMTEPAVASSDASNIATTIRRESDEYVVDGRKWYISGAANPRCGVFFVVGMSDPTASAHRRHTVVAVPADRPGVTVHRPMSVFGYPDDSAEITFENVRVPVANRLGDEGHGFAVGQVRLAAARLQHCMRMIGLAERALELTCRRADERVAFGGPLSRQSQLTAQVADSRIALDRTRLYVLHTAALVDSRGSRNAQSEISAAKVLTMRTAVTVLDRAVGVHGAMGVSQDSPLARWWALARGLHIADGPEEVHLEVVARHEFAAQEAHA
ncbi:acyl-CoA dehydrogenase [Rhodococcus sp. SC4]|nr:acyl-CoA dehydrogenase [Rhodococcus sp. SC4]